MVKMIFWRPWEEFGSWSGFWSVVDAGVCSGALGLWWVTELEVRCFRKVEFR